MKKLDLIISKSPTLEHFLFEKVKILGDRYKDGLIRRAISNMLTTNIKKLNYISTFELRVEEKRATLFFIVCRIKNNNYQFNISTFDDIYGICDITDFTIIG